jgi:hypothetical protein
LIGARKHTCTETIHALLTRFLEHGATLSVTVYRAIKSNQYHHITANTIIHELGESVRNAGYESTAMALDMSFRTAKRKHKGNWNTFREQGYHPETKSWPWIAIACKGFYR